MRLSRPTFLHLAACAAVPLVLLVQSVASDAAEIKVLSAGAARQPQRELFSQFERATGHKIVTEFDFGIALKRRIEAGEAFDVAILTIDVDELVKQGKIAPGSRVVLGRTGVGVAVQRGAPKPDIGTSDSFRRTLLNAKTVAHA